ncbi:MAG: biopolymer transporter ExbD [Leptospiraceae bacterium]|nr:biopolymer transporter ExbD [Leptospiraceae bacterium]
MRYSHKRQRNVSENESKLDMSSLMDIVFILLIFVMVSMSFTTDFKWMEMDLPESGIGVGNKKDEQIISIKANGDYFLDRKKINFEQLKEFSEKNVFQNKTITLNVDKQVPYEFFIKTVGVLKKGNIQKLNLGVEN